jgi:hypothetical protein
LWILGEYSDQSDTISRVFDLVRESLGELPILEMETMEGEGGAQKQGQDKKESKMSNENKVWKVGNFLGN